MGNRVFKDSLYAEFATLGKALANPHRLELLDLLAQGERSVEELAREAVLSLANASAHLQVLRRARLVEAEKRGLNVVYRLAAPEVFQLWRTLRDVGSTRVAEIDRLVENYFTERDELEADLRRRVELLYHPVGTCRMGDGPDAVLDPELRVRGLEALRVVDASVFPVIPGGNTNAPTIMVAERAADLIRGRVGAATARSGAAAV